MDGDKHESERNRLISDLHFDDESLTRWGTFTVAWLLLLGPIASITFYLVSGFGWLAVAIFGTPVLLGLSMSGLYYGRTWSARKQIDALNRKLKSLNQNK